MNALSAANKLDSAYIVGLADYFGGHDVLHKCIGDMYQRMYDVLKHIEIDNCEVKIFRDVAIKFILHLDNSDILMVTMYDTALSPDGVLDEVSYSYYEGSIQPNLLAGTVDDFIQYLTEKGLYKPG